ncbi:hypothetical protein CEXT_188631 [Caerostris extrusa]|uniref:Uncharacterized protein n=1 Tax=Caerostris extrusa TaxID=172846 RepID=A0AAV4NRB5_CAEEX|nr:hypothetical protein CEXT_188631 [Caerostris extrusa]
MAKTANPFDLGAETGAGDIMVKTIHSWRRRENNGERVPKPLVKSDSDTGEQAFMITRFAWLIPGEIAAASIFFFFLFSFFIYLPF